MGALQSTLVLVIADDGPTRTAPDSPGRRSRPHGAWPAWRRCCTSSRAARLRSAGHVRGLTTLPMSLDEVIVDAATLARAADAGAMEAINLKIGRVGGLSTARVMRDLAHALGIGCVIEDSWRGDVLTAAVSHLAASGDGVLVRRITGETLTADRLIVSAGAWLPQLIEPELARLFTVRRQILTWFEIESGYDAMAHQPAWIYDGGGPMDSAHGRNFYGFPAIDGSRRRAEGRPRAVRLVASAVTPEVSASRSARARAPRGARRGVGA